MALERGEAVKLRAFGTFSVRSKRPRVGRNPKTGAEYPISARRVLTFKPSPRLVAAINGETLEDDADDGVETAHGKRPLLAASQR